MFFSLTSADVLSEEAILKWYKDAHAAKGKSIFLEQMKKFVEWLQNAEEGNNDIIFIILCPADSGVFVITETMSACHYELKEKYQLEYIYFRTTELYIFLFT